MYEYFNKKNKLLKVILQIQQKQNINYILDIMSNNYIIIFGASGDISNRKILPGLYEWFSEIYNTQNIRMILLS